jgi:alkylated DNA repair dioxygenase AlkB
VEHATNTKYNFVSVNFYANGQDSIAFDSDDEHWLGDQPCIASLSLSSERDFHMKNKSNENLKQNVVLNSGDLIVMLGKIQHAWLHVVPKRSTQLSGRINITFRRAYLPEGTNNYYRQSDQKEKE